MAKKPNYFPHDHFSRGDEKIINLLKSEDWQGYGIYWAIIEKLHEAGGWLQDNPESLAFDMRTQCERITNVLHNYDLFVFDDGKFSSNRVLDNIELIKQKSEKAQKSASIRWKNANAMQTQCDSNAIKESKVNKRKENICVTSDTQIASNYFYDAYKKHKGSDYIASFGKDGKIFKDLLNIIPLTELQGLIDKFFTSQDQFITQTDHNIGVFRSVVNRLRNPSQKEIEDEATRRLFRQ